MRWPPFSSRQTARHRPRPRSAVEEVGENHRRTGELARRTRVRYALFPLLRPLTLRCTRRKGAADDPTWSPADPGAFPVKSSLREMGSRGLSSCGLCRAGLASREPRWISASRPGITGTDFGRAPGAVAHPGRGGASLGRIQSGRAFGSSAGHLGRPTSSTHPSSRAPRSVSTSLNPRARTSSRRARGLSDVLADYPAISRVGRHPDAEIPAGIATTLRNAPRKRSAAESEKALQRGSGAAEGPEPVRWRGRKKTYQL